MASPQLENGHVRIANEIWDNLYESSLSGSEFKILFCIIRHSWGWHKKECELSIRELSEKAKLSERMVTKSVKILEYRKMLIVMRGTGRGNLTKWIFNKDFEQWIKGELESPPLLFTLSIKGELDGIQRMNDHSPLLTKQFTLSPDKPLETKKNKPPKTIFKDNKDKNRPSVNKSADEAFDLFAKLFEEKNAAPYMHFTGDFVQLSALRRLYKIGGKETPPNWEAACNNYLDSPMGSYSIAEMIKGNRYSVLIKSKLNRYGKPDDGNNEKGGQLRKIQKQTILEPEDYPTWTPGGRG
jgi:phage replication O-like protein O